MNIPNVLLAFLLRTEFAVSGECGDAYASQRMAKCQSPTQHSGVFL